MVVQAGVTFFMKKVLKNLIEGIRSAWINKVILFSFGSILWMSEQFETLVVTTWETNIYKLE